MYVVGCTGSARRPELGDRLAELHHRAVGARHRAVAGLAAHARAHPAEALLGDLHGIEGGVA
jgi:hypothetical protein